MGMSDVGADDDVEPYKSLVEERDRIAVNKKRIAQALLTGGRRTRIFIDQPAKLLEINKMYFGIPAVLDGDEIILEAALGATYGEHVLANRFRMSSYLFNNIHTDIQHEDNGCSLFLIDLMLQVEQVQPLYSGWCQLCDNLHTDRGRIGRQSTQESAQIWDGNACMGSVTS